AFAGMTIYLREHDDISSLLYRALSAFQTHPEVGAALLFLGHPRFSGAATNPVFLFVDGMYSTQRLLFRYRFPVGLGNALGQHVFILRNIAQFGEVSAHPVNLIVTGHLFAAAQKNRHRDADGHNCDHACQSPIISDSLFGSHHWDSAIVL
ncbi:MAG: hypothetical protein JXX14_10400, partial [Deltaproteobacteria bacterium]|nr:hypothetical protein [Deltaproteobacteria bacterium]